MLPGGRNDLPASPTKPYNHREIEFAINDIMLQARCSEFHASRRGIQVFSSTKAKKGAAVPTDGSTQGD